MNIDLSKLNYRFVKKPILVGGGAMEYYGLRMAGNDIDLVACEEDIKNLVKIYPDKLKDLAGDFGVCPKNFEIWRCIWYYDYDFFLSDAIEKESYLVVSIEKLMFTKALVMDKEKYKNDLKLIVGHIVNTQTEKYSDQNNINQNLVKDIPNITFLEQTTL